MKVIRLGIVAGLSMALLAASPAARAEGQKHALLIGIGDYTYGVPALEGPPFDIRALQKSLTEHWGFSPANIRVLMDKEATKAKILASLDGLAATTKPSDFLFIYFSGHGTSSYQRSDLGLDGNTGALVPADLDLEASDIGAGLIVGSRDLRPRLERLDKEHPILVVFDSCYSGAAVRSLRAVGRPRFVPLPTRDLSLVPPAPAPGAASSPAGSAPPYPYKNLVYISAASQSEAARDVTSVDIRGGRAHTIDNQPHGALTNALLEGLAGNADTNHDGIVSYGEFYEYIRDHVSESFPQQPQLLVPEYRADVVRSAGILSTRTPSAPAALSSGPFRAGAFRVKLEKIAAPIEQKMRSLPGVVLVEGAYDLLVAQERDSSYTLFHESGDVLATYAAAQSADVVERVARQAAVKELIDLSFPDQDFNLSLSIPGNRGFLQKGEQFTIDFGAEKDSYVLVLDVDSTGYVSVLFPFGAKEVALGRQGRIPPPPDSLKVSPPFGTEYLKVFAFREKPVGFDRWIGGSFSPLGPELGQLLQMLKTAKGSKAQNRLKVVTRESAS